MTITFKQSVYAQKILQTYGAWDKPSVTVKTPLEAGVRLTKEDSPTFINPALHRRYRVSGGDTPEGCRTGTSAQSPHLSSLATLLPGHGLPSLPLPGHRTCAQAQSETTGRQPTGRECGLPAEDTSPSS
mmetsp:Transcript_23114/g.54804  ORF Transcript_23114/g.54804 Transcript_23114/m.54804 type:complete len:129 (-) Transcript_23114:1729-2115(-)